MKAWPALDVGAGVSGAGSVAGTGSIPAGSGLSPDDIELLHAALVDHEVSAIEERDDALRIFFPASAARDAAVSALRHEFPHFHITSIDVPDEDWAVRSQASLKAVQIGDIIVAPPWDVSAAATTPDGAAPLVIVIQPSMGFGTGHHATTRLCLELLQQIDLRGHHVIDVGTGSGVLAIAASLRGAAGVTGIDIDADALEAARDNLALNPAARVTFRLGSLDDDGPHRFDVAFANLTGGLLIQSASRLQALAPELVLSGFQSHEEADVRAAFSGCSVAARAEEEGWVCVRLSR